MILPALAVYGLPPYRAPFDPSLIMLAGVCLLAVFDRIGLRHRWRAGADTAGPRPAVSA